LRYICRYPSTNFVQMIPSDITFDANATPPQWTDNGEQLIEKGTNIRIKIKGLRSEVDKMYAVGTMKEVSCSRTYLPVYTTNDDFRTTLARYLHSI
jgi:DNA-directed RNA polymerase subunit E'/Rpb7